jgi:hypothetical protein
MPLEKPVRDVQSNRFDRGKDWTSTLTGGPLTSCMEVSTLFHSDIIRPVDVWANAYSELFSGLMSQYTRRGCRKLDRK